MLPRLAFVMCVTACSDGAAGGLSPGTASIDVTFTASPDSNFETDPAFQNQEQFVNPVSDTYAEVSFFHRTEVRELRLLVTGEIVVGTEVPAIFLYIQGLDASWSATSTVPGSPITIVDADAAGFEFTFDYMMGPSIDNDALGTLHIAGSGAVAFP